MPHPDELAQALREAFPGARVSARDTTGGGDHFEVEVGASAFAGKNLVEQHRLVYAALGRLMPAIHALSLRTRAL